VCIIPAWQHISPEMNEKGFKKCCMSTALDETDDDDDDDMSWNGSKDVGIIRS